MGLQPLKHQELCHSSANFTAIVDEQNIIRLTKKYFAAVFHCRIDVKTLDSVKCNFTRLKVLWNSAKICHPLEGFPTLSTKTFILINKEMLYVHFVITEMSHKLSVCQLIQEYLTLLDVIFSG